MKPILSLIILLASLAAATAQDPPATRPADALTALEQKLHGTWRGGACVGDYTFRTDGTYVLSAFTPGGNTLTGTWSIRWDSLPPTLTVLCKTSDFKKNDRTRDEYAYLNKPLEIKLLELNDETLRLRFVIGKHEERYSKYEESYKRR